MRRSLLILVLALLPLGCGGPPPSGTGFAHIQRQVYLMGTLCSLETYAASEVAGADFLEELLQNLESSEQELSTWRADSLLSRINQHPLHQPFALQAGLCSLFRTIYLWHEETSGAFDPAVGPLIEAWKIREEGRVPSREELQPALARSGLAHFLFSGDSCTISRRADTWIDSGAFGKGEALDRLLRITSSGSPPWLVDLGGQIMVHGVPPGRSFWRVGLAGPVNREKPAMELKLASGSVATSGSSERDLQLEGRRVGHILDPRTGHPAAFEGSVTVWNQTGLIADILSTSLYVMGPREGFDWAESKKIAACFLMPPTADSRARRMRCTNAFRSIFPQD